MFAGNVVRVLTDIGSVAQLPRGRDVTDHALATDLQPVSFFVQGASTYSGKHHVAGLLIVQIDRGFQAAKGMRYFVNDAVDQLIEIKNRSDLLRSFLYSLQVFDKIGRQTTDGRNRARDGAGNRSHGSNPCFIQAY